MAAADTISKARVEVPTGGPPGRTVLLSESLAEAPGAEWSVITGLPLRLFGAVADARLRLKKPFQVHIERTDDGFVACAEEIGEFGCGPDSGQALHDLGKTISELYFSLNADKDRLSTDLEALRARLDEYIEIRRPPGRADQR